MRIACILGPGFEDSEFRVPYDAFSAAGHEVIVIGAKKGEKVEGKAGKESWEPEMSIDEARPESFEALFIPGGHSPDVLRADPKFVNFTRGFEDKPIFAICHGPQLLITADMTQGRKMTAWKTVQKDLHYAGATVMDQEVVVDGNLVTSRKPEDLPAFIRESLAMIGEQEPARLH